MKRMLDQRAGAPSLCGQAERIGKLQPGEERALWGPHSNLSVHEGGLVGKLGKDFV